MRPAAALLAGLLGACSFPDVLTEDGLATSATGEPTGPGSTSGEVSTSAGPSTGGGASTVVTTGGEGASTSTSDASSTTGAAGGGGDGGGSPATGGAPGTGGDGGAGGDATMSSTTTGSGSGGSGPCPAGCGVCNDACPVGATVGDCDDDGDPDASDCQMCDERVFTGQDAYFDVAYARLQGGTSFDYDCSGSATTDYNEGECSGVVCPNVERFYSEPPACGLPATSVSCKAVAVVGCTTDQTFNDPVACH